MGETRVDSQDNYYGSSVSSVAEEINVAWNAKNVRRYGSAVEQYPKKNIRYFLYPTWRSQVGNLFLFFITSLITISASNWVEWTVVTGPIFTVFDTTFVLHFPLLIFLPGSVMAKIFVRLYDAEYIIDGRGVEAKVGIVSFMLRQPRLRYEDIRGVEPSQTILERMLGIGHLEIGSAMKEEVEIVMEGVADPRAVQIFLSEEIERSLRRITQSSMVAAPGASSSAASAMFVRGD